MRDSSMTGTMRTSMSGLQKPIRACINEGVARPTFVIDNAPARARVESEVEELKDVQLLRLAPYSFSFP